MSSLVNHRSRARQPQARQNTVAPRTIAQGLTFDWVMSLLGMLFLGGVFLDGWAHNHNKVDQTFFTPWHAFFYSGFLTIALLLAGTIWLNRRRGLPWNKVLPVGYSLSVPGALIFAAGGVGDMLWHEAFGVEAAFDALFSPTHLTLAIGMNLMIAGPLRAAWARPGRQLTWRTAGPMLLSLTGIISGLTFLTMASHPLVSNIAGATHDYGNRIGQIAGTTSVLLTSALLTGPILLVIRRWQLPAGSLIVVWGINTLAMFLVNWHHDYAIWQALAFFTAIVIVELLRLRLEPLRENRTAFRQFAALAPFLLMASYFIALLMTEGTHWTIHMWAGIVVEAGIAGWLLSYLALPPTMPDEESGQEA